MIKIVNYKRYVNCSLFLLTGQVTSQRISRYVWISYAYYLQMN
jgi:hypothetical protein